MLERGAKRNARGRRIAGKSDARTQTFPGEMHKDRSLFGSPRMKAARDAMRKHVDVMHTAKACAETMLSWAARYEMWSQQVDEHYDYKLLDKKLSARQNKQRFNEYSNLQRRLHTWMAEAFEQVLRCYAEDGPAVLAQMMVASKMKAQSKERAYATILAGLSGVQISDGKAVGSSIGDAPPREPDETNATLKLLCASMADKSITYKIPHPYLHIDGVPDEDEQATPRQQIKKTVCEMLTDSGKEIP